MPLVLCRVKCQDNKSETACYDLSHMQVMCTRTRSWHEGRERYDLSCTYALVWPLITISIRVSAHDLHVRVHVCQSQCPHVRVAVEYSEDLLENHVCAKRLTQNLIDADLAKMRMCYDLNCARARWRAAPTLSRFAHAVSWAVRDGHASRLLRDLPKTCDKSVRGWNYTNYPYLWAFARVLRKV